MPFKDKYKIKILKNKKNKFNNWYNHNLLSVLAMILLMHIMTFKLHKPDEEMHAKDDASHNVKLLQHAELMLTKIIKMDRNHLGSEIKQSITNMIK